MRPVLVLLVALLALAGCARDWGGDVRFKVRETVTLTSGRQIVALDVDGDAPADPIKKFTSASAAPDQFPADIKPGEVVVCAVAQHDANGFDSGELDTTVGPCRRP
jgi:hypothetical protein